jgi:hypothetical protein
MIREWLNLYVFVIASAKAKLIIWINEDSLHQGFSAWWLHYP